MKKRKNTKIENLAKQIATSAAASLDAWQDPIWKTRKQMARRLQVSEGTISYRTEDGTLPVFKKGRVVRYHPAEYELVLKHFRPKSRFDDLATNKD